MTDRFQVGIITKPHGVKGAVKVLPTTDDARRFKPGCVMTLEGKNVSIPVTVETVQFFKQTVILKLKEFHSPEQAEGYRGCSLMVDRSDAVALKKDEYFLADLEGMDVLSDEDGQKIGTVTDVMTTGANEVIVVKMCAGQYDGTTVEEGREALFPSIKECIKQINVEEGFIRVHIMPGLLD